MTGDEKVRWFYARFRDEHPSHRRVSLLQFVQRQARKRLGTSLYGNPSIYQRWLKKRGWDETE